MEREDYQRDEKGRLNRFNKTEDKRKRNMLAHKPTNYYSSWTNSSAEKFHFHVDYTYACAQMNAKYFEPVQLSQRMDELTEKNAAKTNDSKKWNRTKTIHQQKPYIRLAILRTPPWKQWYALEVLLSLPIQNFANGCVHWSNISQLTIAGGWKIQRKTASENITSTFF